MPTEIDYRGPNHKLHAHEFLELAMRVWPGNYSTRHTEQALAATQNFTAWHDNRLIGCARLLTDGYVFSTVPEILVEPAYQRRSIGAKLMNMLWEASPTSLGFGVQTGNEQFFESLGYEAKMQFYAKRKPRAQHNNG